MKKEEERLFSIKVRCYEIGERWKEGGIFENEEEKPKK